MPAKKMITTVRRMSEPERSYLGAMIDGEGSIGRYISGNSRNSGQSILALSNQSLEIISALLRFTGVGSVSLKDSPSTRNPSPKALGGVPRRPVWDWRITNAVDVGSVASQSATYSVKCQNYLRGLNGTGSGWLPIEVRLGGF